MLEDFAASLKSEEEAFDGLEPKNEEQVNARPDATPAENEEKKDAPSPEGANTQEDNNTPFHKHPRWIKQQEELKELRKFREEKAPLLDQFAEYLSKQQNQETEKLPPIPEWFSGLYGQDQNAWKNYLQQEQGIRAQIKNEVIQELQAETQREQAEKQKWTNWVNESLESLKDSGEEFDEVRLQEIALEYLPTDLEGNIDFRKALSIMRKLDEAAKPAVNTAQVSARKAVAALTSSKSTGDKAKPNFETNRSLRNKTFDNLISD